MSAVSARDLGYLTPEQMIDRCSSTWRHSRSWSGARATFSIGTTRGLSSPCGLHMYRRSTVETSSPACGLLAQACEGLERQPQLEGRALRGLADTLAVVIERFPPDRTTAIPLETLGVLFHEKSSGIEVMDRIRLAAEPARKLTESLRWTVSEIEERTLLVHSPGGAGTVMGPVL
jgi:hypothetical protein